MIDYTRTAVRRGWDTLPDSVQEYIQGFTGGVDTVALAGGGFTPGFAATVSGPRGQVFAKAAPESSGFVFHSYVAESRVVAALPDGVPMPALLAASQIDADCDVWQVTVFAHVDGFMPGQPWTSAEFAATERALLALDAAVPIQPAGLAVESLVGSFVTDPEVLRVFADISSGTAHPPSYLPRLTQRVAAELDKLTHDFHRALAGTSVIHNDLRPDNILIREEDGAALFCDWNYLCIGPRWADWVVLLAYARDDGLDSEEWLHASELSRDADPHHVNVWLALLAAYMVQASAKPEVPSSPQLRNHGRYSAVIFLNWLLDRLFPNASAQVVAKRPE